MKMMTRLCDSNVTSCQLCKKRERYQEKIPAPRWSLETSYPLSHMFNLTHQLHAQVSFIKKQTAAIATINKKMHEEVMNLPYLYLMHVFCAFTNNKI